MMKHIPITIPDTSPATKCAISRPEPALSAEKFNFINLLTYKVEYIIKIKSKTLSISKDIQTI